MDHGESHLGPPVRLALIPTATLTPLAHRPSNHLPLLALMLATVAIGVAASPLIASAVASVVLAAAGVSVAIAAVIALRASRRPRPKAPTVEVAPTCLVVDRESIHLARPECTPEHLISLTTGFGFALLTTADRSHLVVAMTTTKGMFCVGSDVGPIEQRRFDLLMPHAVTVSRDELTMATRSPLGDSLLVDSTSLLRIIDVLIQADATSLGRYMLTDSQGREVLLDRDRLTTPRGTIRLDQPFEWRALRFREGGGVMDAEFQGTWIRQGMQEIVLVSLLTGDVRNSIHDIKESSMGLDAMLRQDIRLADAPRCPPPPFDQRIAVDRLFMLPLRRALDGAHFETRDSIPGGASLG
jgi:hypothetical protein